MDDAAGAPAILKESGAGALIIDGKVIAAQILTTVARHAGDLRNQSGLQPGIAVVIVGEDPASQVYVKSKGKAAVDCGFKSVQHTLPAETSEGELLALVAELNGDATVHGILVQLPLPGHIDTSKIIQAISPDKDVDGFHPVNAGRLAIGEVSRALIPCTPAGSMVLLRRTAEALGLKLTGLEAVVVGRSNIVGKPVAQLLLAESCTVTIAHSRTRDLPGVVRRADIVVAAVGRPEMIEGDWIKPGALVIDVGINRLPGVNGAKGRLVGDVAYRSASSRARAITPVPGGVGPMTIAMLMANTLAAACRSSGLSVPEF